MHVSKRVWLRVAVVVVVVLFLLARVGRQRHMFAPASKAVPDLALTSPLNQQGGTPAADESYQLYSDLYKDPVGEALVIANDSETDIPQVNGSCLQPSTPQEHEMADAFVAANRQSHRWEQKFSIAQGYRLISSADAANAENCIQTKFADAARCARFKDVGHVRFLGIPGFDSTHTRALVSVLKKCGRYCGSGGIFVAEMINGKWRRADATKFTSDCSWMY
jgi:hypothetical protein